MHVRLAMLTGLSVTLLLLLLGSGSLLMRADQGAVVAAMNNVLAIHPPRAIAAPNLAATPTPTPSPLTTRPPIIKSYCWNTAGTVQGPSRPPTPFLYQPFGGHMSGDIWTSQMDHDRPDYYMARNGVIATLGETLRYNYSAPGVGGGTETGYLEGKRWITRRFPTTASYESILSQGFKILAYQSPSYETYLYYDGHDGHDFGVGGSVLAGADGEVVFAGNYGDSLGRVIEIYHPQGYLTRYAHLASFGKGISVGAPVTAGQSIGAIGGSGCVGKEIRDGYWPVHLHFSVFRWNNDRRAWQITDPFGWDPWAGPDRERRERKQREDPLVRCNGEVSYDLWVDEWPRPVDSRGGAQSYRPAQDRYVGGWVEMDEEGGAGREKIPRPLDAAPEVPLVYDLVLPGEEAHLHIEMRNTGTDIWTAAQGMGLCQLQDGKVAKRYAVPHNVAPGNMIGWDVPVAPGKTTLTILTFQACQGNNFFGSDVRAIIVVVPEEWREQVERLRQEIDRQIEEWKRQGGQEIEKLEQQLLETLRRELERQTQKWLQEICGSNALLFALLGGLFLTAFVARRS